MSEAKKRTGYGRRNRFTGRKIRRKRFYPAHWAWEERLLTLAQVDVEDVLDKGTLRTKLWDHLAKRKLPRYEWTFLEGRTRLRFLALSHEITLTNGLCFMSLVMLWLRGDGIEGEVVWQTDFSEEFGGSNPHRTDDEELYIPFLEKDQTEEGFSRRAAGWGVLPKPLAAGWLIDRFLKAPMEVFLGKRGDLSLQTPAGVFTETHTDATDARGWP